MQNDGEFLYAGVAILFEIDDKTPNLPFDNFFEAMKMKEDNAEVKLLPFNKAMKEVDWANRYVYKGSMTTPPCEKYVQWSVIKTIYKIRSQHV